MTKQEAVKEARIAALYQGGEHHVTRKYGEYFYVASDRFESVKHGRIVETFTPEKVRRTIPAGKE